MEVAHQIEDRTVEDAKAGAQGGVAQGLGQTTLAHAGRPEQEDSPVLADKLAGGQFKDLAAFDRGVEAPVEVLQRFEIAEGGSFFAPFQLALGAHVEFVLQEQFQELRVR